MIEATASFATASVGYGFLRVQDLVRSAPSKSVCVTSPLMVAGS